MSRDDDAHSLPLLIRHEEGGEYWDTSSSDSDRGITEDSQSTQRHQRHDCQDSKVSLHLKCEKLCYTAIAMEFFSSE